MVKKSLKALLTGIVDINSAQNKEILGLSADSRTVKPGYLFFALQGKQVDGRQYIEAAIKNRAVAIVQQHNKNASAIKTIKNIPLIAIKNVEQKLGLIASRFFDHPSQKLSVIGVTGTNGKTSITQFIAQLLSHCEMPCAVIGTLGNGMSGHLLSGTHTTPDAISLQTLLSQLLDQGAKAVVMEVSSHGLDQGRVNSIEFDIAVFTNLTRDHLDYHENMENYAHAKRRLFEFPNLKAGVINFDDPFGQQLIKTFSKKYPLYVYSIDQLPISLSRFHSVYCTEVSLTSKGIKAKVHTPWGDGVIESQLLGRFNLSNLLAVITVLGIQGIPLEKILSLLPTLRNVPGRMEVLGGGENPLIVIDYAHTPDALQSALLALREHCRGKLWCVFGCGGARDNGKRPIMGNIAEQYADFLVITDDNPRHEKPAHIVADIVKGLNKKDAVIEHDRRRAIAHAIQCAKANDIVLVAGKGHETYQQIGDEKFPFNDAVEVQLVLNENNEYHGK